MTVPGDTIEKLNLTEFSIQQKGKTGTIFNTSDNLQATFRFQNQGNVQVGPFGKISVKQGDKVVYESDFNIDNPRDVILPDSARRWDVPLKDIGDFGNFTVIATLTYGKNNQTIELTSSIWIIPWIVIIGAGVVLLLIVAAIIVTILLVRRSRARKRSSSRRNRRY